MSKEMNEKRRAYGCMHGIEERLACGSVEDIQQAKWLTVELLNSLRELEKIQVKYEQRKNIEALVSTLQKSGVNIDRAVRFV